MTKAQRIEAYIKECFDTYSINMKEYFSVMLDGETHDIVWVDKKGKIDMRIVEYVSEILGLNVEDILTRNDNAVAKWWKKYPYLWHLKAYNYAYDSTFFGKGYADMKLFEAIFDTKLDYPYPSRYDIKDIAHRLDQELREIDKSLPGTYHEGAQITNLSVTTDNFCDFDEIEEMTESYITMICNFKVLVLRALKEELSQDEICELNFLSTILGFRDRFYTKGFLRYNELISMRDIFCDVTEENFDDYFVLRKALNFRPWCCLNFVSNKSLVERYLSVLPCAKSEMRRFSVQVSQFFCSFIWSDAELVEPDPEIADYFDDEDLEEPIKQRTTLYIPKTKEEFGNGDEYAKLLIEYSRPVKLGGIQVRTPAEMAERSVLHIQTMMKRTFANDFHTWCAIHSTGGGANE